MRKLLQKLSRPSKKTGAPGSLTPDQFQSPVQAGDAGVLSNSTSASAAEEEPASIPTQSHEPSPLSPPEREKHGLFLLYPESRSAICDVDIVAVHGLGGDWEDTWTHAAGKSWLKDFLPSDFPNARIWSFGYDSSLLGKTVAGINDAAKSLVSSLHGKRRFTGSESKPVIFVAHSLGGIVVKQALILAIQRSDYWGSIATSTKGLVFFGVPHRGADKAYWAALVVRIAQFSSLGIRGSNKFVDSLKRNSAEFANISQAFIQPGARLTIRSFYETERMGNSLIVDQDSATIGTNNEIALPIWGDHRQICKFASSDSEQYENVLMALRDMIPGTGGEATSIGKEPVSRLHDLKTKIDEYMHRLQGIEHQRERGEPHSADQKWILNMAQTKDWKTRKAFSILSVLYQMLHKNPRLYTAFQQCYRKSHGRPAPQWTFEDLEQCLFVLRYAKGRGMIKGCTYLLVVDGLDESEDNDVSGVPREKALNMLSRLCLPNGNHTFKIIALSRNETVIKRHIPTRHFLDMKDMNKRDIEQIIDAEIKRMWKKIRHSADLPNVSSEDHPNVYESDKKHYKLDVIRQRLIDHADGVILWVVLVLRELGALFEDPSCTPTRILKALDKIPENLEDLYEDMFVRLRASPTRSHAKAARLFTWLLFAQNTLKVCEVRDIIAMFNWRISDPSTTDHDNLANHRNMQSNDNWQPTKRLLEDLCGGQEIQSSSSTRLLASSFWIQNPS
ncbi:Protein SERAC1 [Colletotrichum spinosum]|uniref:Protein SERAC1 n=1 Tax=Colletotrichum spinosum TaxID=1347390 RepID=A0A4R8QJG5_9PEZI|nr:Protein SERAC1 [Colletotrichum spinosum]